MEAMHIRIDTNIRIKAKDGEAIRIVGTIRTMDGGSQNNIPLPQVNEPPLEKKVDLEQALS